MFLAVLIKNLNWESLTKNLVLTLLWGFTEKSDFSRVGGEGMQTKSGRWGRGVAQFSE